MPLSDGELTEKEIQEAVDAAADPVYRAKPVWDAVAHAQRRKLATYLIQRSELMYGEGNMTARWLMEEFHNLEPWPDPEPTGEAERRKECITCGRPCLECDEDD